MAARINCKLRFRSPRERERQREAERERERERERESERERVRERRCGIGIRRDRTWVIYSTLMLFTHLTNGMYSLRTNFVSDMSSFFIASMGSTLLFIKPSAITSQRVQINLSQT